MKASLIQGLNEKDMQAIVNSYNLNPWYYPTLFPLKWNPTLTIKDLIINTGVPIAADIISFDSSIPKKKRPVPVRFDGDIPKIAASRIKGESDINRLFELQNFAKTTPGGAQALLDFIYEDMDFVWKAVNARLEWVALQALSLGEVTLTKANNNGVVTETAIDFGVPTSHKSGAAVVWSTANAATMTPYTDIKNIVKTARQDGVIIGAILMDQDTFDIMIYATEIQKIAASWVVQASGTQVMPTLDQINSAFNGRNLPPIKIIQSYVTIEKNDGTQTVVNPWTSGVVTFLPSTMCGNTYYAPLATEMIPNTESLIVKREHILIQKYSEESPVTENTIGMANAFPGWSTALQSWLLDSLHASTWNH